MVSGLSNQLSAISSQLSVLIDETPFGPCPPPFGELFRSEGGPGGSARFELPPGPYVVSCILDIFFFFSLS
jgi:hypothetical protein